MRRAVELQDQDGATQRTVLLAEASMSLSRSLDLDTTLAEVGRLLVPRFADWCSVQMLNDGRLETVALQHRDPETTEWARSLMGAFPTRMDAPHGAANVVRSGRSEIYPLISTDLIEANAASAEHLALVRRLGLTSAIVVPLAGRDGVVGTVTLIHAESGRRYSEEDCVFLEAVADRVAVALDTAATFEQQSERLAGVTLVAEAAQRAILAPPPARVGPVALSARYLSAAREAQIGGDLYEVVRGPSSLRLLVGGAAKYSTTVVVPQARVELATFRLGGGCTPRADLRRKGPPTAIDIAFPYGSPLRESQSVPQRTHWHGSAPPAHLHHMTAPTDLPLIFPAGLPVLLTIHDIASLLRLHRTAAYARTREPDFPDPLVISGACYRWYTHEVLAYVDARRTPKTVPRPRRGEEDCSLPSVVAHAVPRVRASRRKPHDAGPDVSSAGDRRSH